MKQNEAIELQGLKKLASQFNELDGSELADFRIHLGLLKSRIDAARNSGTWKSANRNLFRILGCDRNEEVHSNILAWLLDPEESHGIGTHFLKAFIARVFHEELGLSFPIEVVKNKQTGGDRPDVVVRGHNWLVVLENKIDAAEGVRQTLRYSERWKGLAARQGMKCFFAFLSPKGFAAESIDFVPVSYKTIREILESLQPIAHSGTLLSHLIDHILDDLECT